MRNIYALIVQIHDENKPDFPLLNNQLCTRNLDDGPFRSRGRREDSIHMLPLKTLRTEKPDHTGGNRSVQSTESGCRQKSPVIVFADKCLSQRIQTGFVLPEKFSHTKHCLSVESIDLFQLRQHMMTKAVAGISIGGVGTVLHIRNTILHQDPQ